MMQKIVAILRRGRPVRAAFFSNAGLGYPDWLFSTEIVSHQLARDLRAVVEITRPRVAVHTHRVEVEVILLRLRIVHAFLEIHLEVTHRARVR